MTKPITSMTNKKKFRLPNGFGSIIRRDDGNRRKSYEVRKSVNGNQKMLSFYSTYEEVIGFLVDYNKNPSLFTPQLITFSEIYNLMGGERFKKLAKATVANYKAVYKYRHQLYSIRFVEITIQDVIHTMSEQGMKYAPQKKCRQLMHHKRTSIDCNDISATDTTYNNTLDDSVISIVVNDNITNRNFAYINRSRLCQDATFDDGWD